MKSSTKKAIGQAAVVVSGILLLWFIAHFSSDEVQSGFQYKLIDGAHVFMDRNLESAARAEIQDGLQDATVGALARLGIRSPSRPLPTAFFVTNLNYGAINSSDSFLAKKLPGAASSDFAVFRNLSLRLYANELVADTITSRDGQYVFLTANGDWRRAALHGHVHALAARNMPAQLAASMNVDTNFNEDTWFSFRFVDEAVALFVTDIQALSGHLGSMDAAARAYPAHVRDAYASDSSPIAEQERLIWMATFSEPHKLSNFYQAAGDFSAFLLDRLGVDGMLGLCGSFLMGAYGSFDDLFAGLGGLDGAMTAWKGDPAVPRSGMEYQRQ